MTISTHCWETSPTRKRGVFPRTRRVVGITRTSTTAFWLRATPFLVRAKANLEVMAAHLHTWREYMSRKFELLDPLLPHRTPLTPEHWVPKSRSNPTTQKENTRQRHRNRGTDQLHEQS